MTSLASTALLSLGELARKRGDLDAAERYYRDALRRRGGGQRIKAATAQLNLALVELTRGRFDEAEALTGELVDRLEDERGSMVVRWARVVRLPVAAVRDEGRWREAVEPIGGQLDRLEITDPDVAWCLELAGDRAEQAGWSARARWCWILAAKHWSAVGQEERSRAVLARMEGEESA